MPSHLITRQEIADLLGFTTQHIGVMDDRGQLPCPPDDYIDPRQMKKGNPTKYYDREIMLAWIKRRKEPNKEPKGITFKQVFSGQFERHDLKLQYKYKKMVAKHNQPQTIKVKFIGEW